MPSPHHKKYIHADNIHCGGGETLLAALLQAAAGDQNLTVLVDERFAVTRHLPPYPHIHPVKPSLFHRFMAEWWLATNIRPDDKVLCFGNLPPLWRLKGRVTLFLQNRYLLDEINWKGFSLKRWFKLMAERMWLACKLGNADEFVVQTPSMKIRLEASSRLPLSVRILPFVEDTAGYSRGQESKSPMKECRFLYVSSAEPHKNHHVLIEAWCLLAAEKLFPELALTVDKNSFPDLCAFVAEMKTAHGLKIVNRGKVPHKDISELYRTADAFIYPSLRESLGLPLIEARQAGLPIVAAEADYVRDIIDPEQTFDPKSPLSIARAVKRFMGIETSPLPLINAKDFLDRIFEERS